MNRYVTIYKQLNCIVCNVKTHKSWTLNICVKLHEIERMWSGGGGGELRSANAGIEYTKIHYFL